MKEGISVAEHENDHPSDDIPASWGFHLLQELHRMEDKLEGKIDATNARIDALDTKLDTRIDALDTKLQTQINALDTKFQAQIDGLRYWSWGTIIVVIAAAIATILTIVFHH